MSSRNEAILNGIINDDYDFDPPQSRIEALLIDLADKIENMERPSEEVIRQVVEEYLEEHPELMSVIDDTSTGVSKTWSASKLIASFVQKETGKGLSTNDYTDAEKTKVASALTEHQSLKTINGQSIVGTGNIEIQGGGSAAIDDTTIVSDKVWSSQKVNAELEALEATIPSIPEDITGVWTADTTIYIATLQDGDEVVYPDA